MAPTSYQLPALTSPVGIVAIVIGSLLLIYLVERNILAVPLPRGVPLLGEPEGARRFSLRTRLRYYTDCKGVYRDAYHNYSKQGKTVIIPGLGFRREVIMPASSMRWILSQPESSISVADAFAEVDMAHWSVGEKVILDGWQGELVKTEMNRALENICAALNDELGRVFDQQFGTDTQNWKEIDLLSTANMIVAQGAARFTVGAPLCRDQEYLQAVIDTNNLLIMNAGVTGAMPLILRPLVGPPINIPIRSKIKKLKEWVIPIWERRLETLKYSEDDPAHQEPKDHMQMMIRYAAKNCPHELHDHELIVRRVIAANFGATHQTGIQLSNLVLNVIGSDSEFNTVSILRDEIDRASKSDSGDAWTKAKISQMVKADSVARETLRLNSFGGRAVMRKVMVDGLVTNEGVELPKGTFFSYLSQPAQTDSATFEDPFKYDPFRFSRIREDAASRNEQAPAVSFVTTSPDHLPFGHGKHACPGRFLIDFEFKMILAYMLRNYDLKFPDEYKGQRPPNNWMTEAQFPPEGVKIMVRRRQV